MQPLNRSTQRLSTSVRNCMGSPTCRSLSTVCRSSSVSPATELRRCPNFYPLCCIFLIFFTSHAMRRIAAVMEQASANGNASHTPSMCQK